jgi:hypothetical protein
MRRHGPRDLSHGVTNVPEMKQQDAHSMTSITIRVTLSGYGAAVGSSQPQSIGAWRPDWHRRLLSGQ